MRDVTFDIAKNEITALIGPSGCGKSTLLRCLNRMNDLIPSATRRGQGPLPRRRTSTRPTSTRCEVRKRIGMVFQKPNPFPKSIYDNIAFGPRVLGMKGDMDEIVERALRQAALWDEVKDRLKTNAFGMSGGQQQRLCIARCLAVEPDVILMDEPCSALDPISTGKIEDLMIELKREYSIVIVTHNMQQAARVSDKTAFFTVELDEDEQNRTGRVVEFDDTEKIFTNPPTPAPRRTSPARSASPVSDTTRSHFQEELAGARGAGARRPRPRGQPRSTARSRRSSTRTSSSRAWSSPTTTASTAATSRCTRGSCRCSRSRRRWPATCALVAALLHVIKHVERMGDQCVNIAKLVPLGRARAALRIRECSSCIQRMGDQARRQVVQCEAGLRAPRRRAWRRTWCARTTRSTGSTARSSTLALEIGDDADRREWAMHMMLVAPLHRADRRQRRRHRRADRLRRHRPVPGVRGRLAPSRGGAPHCLICACIDIGSNTTRLLVADAGQGRLRELVAQRAFTRIGKSIQNGGLDPAGEDRGDRWSRRARRPPSRARWAPSTSWPWPPPRSAPRPNRDELVDAVEDAGGVELSVLSGEEEARLSFVGATRTLLEAPPRARSR